MPSPFFHALATASPAILSPGLALLQQAELAKFEVTRTFTTQSASFARLVEDNQLFAETKTKLLKKIATLAVPKTLTQELHQLYHQQLGAGFVRIQGWTQYGSTPWISEVKGDANIVESLLTTWIAAIELNLQHGASLVGALTNCQVVIQSQPASPIACGEIFTRHPLSGERHLLVIHLWPGAPHAALANDTPTIYAVDIRTGMIVQRQVGTSKLRASRQSDEAVLTTDSRTAEFLEEKEILELVRQMYVFKRQFGHQLHASFEIDGDKLLLTSIETQQEEHSHHDQPAQLLTKVYLATGRADALDIAAHENCDGIGLLRAEYVFSRLEIHPLSLLKRGRESVILDRLTNFLSEANQSYPNRRIVYRLQNFTTQELRAFKMGDSQERQEPNPYLGWRGGLRLMEQPELFEPELATFDKWLKRRHAPTGLIVPFVRSTAEWRWIVNRWKERHFFDHPEFESWFQLTTPENIANLEDYVLAEVHGLSLNIRTVTALMLGIDPDDPQLQASYPPAIELQQTVLRDVSERVGRLKAQPTHAKLKLHLHLEDFNHTLVSSAVKLRYDGIVMHPAALAIGRSCISTTEQQ